MKALYPFITITILASITVDAQKINLEKWGGHMVDSLQKKQIDTIEYYHEYCGECNISLKPADTSKRRPCEMENTWGEIENTIIYKQKGDYYSLTFNCGYPPIKKRLTHIKSLEYFLSIVPTLNIRDKTLTALQKQHKFAPLPPADGLFKQAVLYCNGVRQRAYLHNDPTTDKTQASFLWMSKQIHLFKLIESELSSN